MNPEPREVKDMTRDPMMNTHSVKCPPFDMGFCENDELFYDALSTFAYLGYTGHLVVRSEMSVSDFNQGLLKNTNTEQ